LAELNGRLRDAQHLRPYHTKPQRTRL
jgi:hypothetical protein